ncbi:MAG: asparaginase domain-containing protein [Candidatus Nomurabacteria bacterium]|nr:asparaginase domain-containing protein [Candidatus Nomurabacteria bacterium]
MKFYILNTGGTLGMIGNPLVPAKSASQLMEGIVVPKNVELQLFDFPKRQDSTNVSHSDRVLVGELIEENYLTHDAFIIFHGTDSLAETTSFLAMMFKQSLQKPLFVIGAQMTKEEGGSEVKMQIENTLRMVKTFVNKNIVGVYNLCISDVLSGARLAKKNESDYIAFHTPGMHSVAKTYPHIMLLDGVRYKDPVLYVQGLRLDKKFERLVATIRVSVDTPPWILADIVEKKRLNGVILQCKGAGQISDISWQDGEKKYSWIDAIKLATDAGIHVGIISPFEDGRVNLERYELGKKVMEAGGIGLASLTPDMGDVKFRMAIAMHPTDPAKIKEFITTNIIGELLPGYEDEDKE